MSDRWTISTYVEGEIVNIGYYRNWREEYMFYEAVAIMATFGLCRTKDEYFQLYTALHPYDSSRSSQSVRRIMHEIEAESEFPVLVDLSRKKIYTSFCLARGKDLLAIHEVGEPYENTNEYLRYAFRKGGYIWNSAVNSRRKFNKERELYLTRRHQPPFPVSEENILTAHTDSMINYYKTSFTSASIVATRKVFREEPELEKYLSYRTVEGLQALWQTETGSE